jgi:carbonic anhydrase
MKKLMFGFAMCMGLFALNAHANDELKQVEAVLMTILHDNAEFSRQHNHSYFEKFSKHQHPRATVVTCADSRVHDQALEHSPDNDLFVVRNIGNQIYTSEGSVEYGIHHLHTPLLLIIGHSACGAVKAAGGDFSHESEPIKRELTSIKLAHLIDPDDEMQVIEGVKFNVNQQISLALKKFSKDVKAGKLMVVGAVYDFTNVMHHGEGRLTIVNVNGNSHPKYVKKTLDRMMQDIQTTKNYQELH